MAKIGRQGDGGGRPKKFTDATVLERLCNDYIDECKKKEEPVLMLGLACFLDCSKETLNEYKNGVYDTVNHRFSEPILKVLKLAELDAIKRLYSKYTLGAMFNLKCNFGYIERQHIDISADVKTTSIEQALDEID